MHFKHILIEQNLFKEIFLKEFDCFFIIFATMSVKLESILNLNHIYEKSNARHEIKDM